MFRRHRMCRCCIGLAGWAENTTCLVEGLIRGLGGLKIYLVSLSFEHVVVIPTHFNLFDVGIRQMVVDDVVVVIRSCFTVFSIRDELLCFVVCCCHSPSCHPLVRRREVLVVWDAARRVRSLVVPAWWWVRW